MKSWRSWYKEIQPSTLKNKNKTIDVEMIKSNNLLLVFNNFLAIFTIKLVLSNFPHIYHINFILKTSNTTFFPLQNLIL